MAAVRREYRSVNTDFARPAESFQQMPQLAGGNLNDFQHRTLRFSPLDNRQTAVRRNRQRMIRQFERRLDEIPLIQVICLGHRFGGPVNQPARQNHRRPVRRGFVGKIPALPVGRPEVFQYREMPRRQKENPFAVRHPLQLIPPDANRNRFQRFQIAEPQFLFPVCPPGHIDNFSAVRRKNAIPAAIRRHAPRQFGPRRHSHQQSTNHSVPAGPFHRCSFPSQTSAINPSSFPGNMSGVSGVVKFELPPKPEYFI